jgi:endonuclease/exonuclease/phosphatase family metal-dependent hydrolase
MNGNKEYSEISMDFPDELPDVIESLTPEQIKTEEIQHHQQIQQHQHQHQHQQQHQQQQHQQHQQLQMHQQLQAMQVPMQAPQPRVVKKVMPTESKNISHLTVVTYNMWFDRHDYVNRAQNLVKMVLLGNKYRPDLICLQEVTPEVYKILQVMIASEYFLFELFESQAMPYTNLIAINKSTMDIVDDSLGYFDLPDTQMGRKIMLCYVMIKRTGTKFHIINAHLESFDANWKNRQTQMNAIEQILEAEKVGNFIMGGDFNIHRDDEPSENLIRQQGYNDSWIEMGSPQSLKYTYDPGTNQFAKGNTRNRFDRILYRFKERIVLTKLKLLGVKQPQPSDHYGVLAEYLIKKAK